MSEKSIFFAEIKNETKKGEYFTHPAKDIFDPNKKIERIYIPKRVADELSIKEQKQKYSDDIALLGFVDYTTAPSPSAISLLGLWSTSSDDVRKISNFIDVINLLDLITKKPLGDKFRQTFESYIKNIENHIQKNYQLIELPDELEVQAKAFIKYFQKNFGIDYSLENLAENISDIHSKISDIIASSRSIKELENSIRSIHAFIEEKEKQIESLEKILGNVNQREKLPEIVNLKKSIEPDDISKICENIELHRGHIFSEEIIKFFIYGLYTHQLLIFFGEPGTGKSSFARDIAWSIGANLLEVPVQPSWSEEQDLFGYFNPVTNEFISTELTEFILRANSEWNSQKESSPLFIVCLDEMNISQVEYYLATVLSRIEIDYRNDSAQRNISLLPPKFAERSLQLISSNKILSKEEESSISKIIRYKNLAITPNIRFVGTINVDETTKKLSPKVIDRSFIINFNQLGDNISKASIIGKNDVTSPSASATYAAKIFGDSLPNFSSYDISKLPDRVKTLISLSSYRTKIAAGVLWNFREIFSISEEEMLDILLHTKILPKFDGYPSVSDDKNIKIIAGLVEGLDQSSASKIYGRMKEDRFNTGIFSYFNF